MSLILGTTDLKCGFLGCGTIAAAIANGLASATDEEVTFSHFHVSKRSASKSAALLERFGPSKVTICESGNNQEILDSSDIIFLCVLPSQMEEVMSKLKFDPARHTVISLVSTSTLPQLISLSSLPATSVFKMICLPSVATHDGTCLLVPKSETVKKILMPLGGCVGCESEEIMTKMMIPACLMGPMYAIMKGNLDWMVKNGVPAEDASYYIGRTYLGIAKDAEAKCTDPKHFTDLIEEQTPGGINQQAIENLTKLGALESYDKTMDKILERLTGKGDGKA